MQVLVTEPTVQDTISILRGIKRKYEVHHGVRIADAALSEFLTCMYLYVLYVCMCVCMYNIRIHRYSHSRHTIRNVFA
jgi:hypothetical protein